MGGLQNFENRLEQLISGAFARAFRSAVQPVEISAALQRELDNNAQILSRERRLVPNSFHVELSTTDLERLAPYDTTLAKELTETLREHAETQSYVFPGPVRIEFDEAEDLTTGRFRVRSAAEAKVTTNATDTMYGRAKVFLEVNGVRHPINPPGLVVGRGTDADLRINDPGHQPAARRVPDPQATVERGRTRAERPRPRLDQRHDRRRHQDPRGHPLRRLHGADRQHHDDRESWWTRSLDE